MTFYIFIDHDKSYENPSFQGNMFSLSFYMNILAIKKKMGRTFAIVFD